MAGKFRIEPVEKGRTLYYGDYHVTVRATETSFTVYRGAIPIGTIQRHDGSWAAHDMTGKTLAVSTWEGRAFKTLVRLERGDYV